MSVKESATVFGGFCVSVIGAAALLGTASTALAHRDTMNGPIIPEAKAALEKSDVTPVLKWVKKENEREVTAAFAKALIVRAQGPEAKELADQYFLETLVRVHRAGEGAPYTGPKDEPVEPLVTIADKALADGSVEDMIQKITGHMEEAIREKFDRVLDAKRSKDESVDAGRAYVEAYVTYMHYMEGIHASIMSAPAHGHEATTDAKPEHDQPVEHKH